MEDGSYRVDLRELGDFSATELYDLLKLRVDVFVVEQECPYPELDGKDREALHLRLLSEDAPIACARVFAPPDKAGEARIGRVAVSRAHRGKRLGEAVMREVIAICEERFPGHPVALSAQSHLQSFYSAFGFFPTSAEYVEDGIPHVDMRRAAMYEEISA